MSTVKSISHNIATGTRYHRPTNKLLNVFVTVIVEHCTGAWQCSTTAGKIAGSLDADKLIDRPSAMTMPAT